MSSSWSPPESGSWPSARPPVPPPPPRPSRWQPLPAALAILASVALAGSLVAAVVADDDDPDLQNWSGATSTDTTEPPFDPADPYPAAWIREPDPELDLPAEWDRRVVDLVDFVEEERGLEFVSPVHVEFLTEDEFEDELRLSEEDRADEEIVESMEEIQALLPMFRALGWMEGDIDLVETFEDFQSVSVAAFYDTEDKRIVVPTTEPTFFDEMTLVHELTHALQDQYFDLSRYEDEDEDADTREPVSYNSDEAFVTPLVEGDAMRVETAWTRSQPASAWDDALEDLEGTEGHEVDEELAEVLDDFPTFISAGFISSYTLGLPMVGLLHEDGGNEAVNQALHDSEALAVHYTDPTTYLTGEEFGTIDPPRAPTGAEVLDDGPFDAWDLFALLAQRVRILDSVRAADGWYAGSYTTYEDDDRVCVRIHVTGVDEETTGDSDEDGDTAADHLVETVEEWVDEAPEETDATFDDSPRGAPDGVVEVETCDPGEDFELERDRLDRAFEALSVRSSIAWEGVRYLGQDLDGAWDTAGCVVEGVLDESELDFDELYEEDPDLYAVRVLMDCGLM